jgi:hypothetical protein
VTQRWFVYPERVLLKNQRGETVLEGEHTYLIAYRPAA